MFDVPRVPKRYIRDMENPIECFHDRKFVERFRFPKIIVLNTLMLLVFNVEQSDDHQGLPISPQIKLNSSIYPQNKF